MAVEDAEVRLWGTTIGAVSWSSSARLGSFEYEQRFQSSGIEPAPLTMPLGPTIWSFPTLNTETFRGLPGMLADALPDKFGSALIEAWLAQHGRSTADFSPVERLCYIGDRGMGALEFAPMLARAEPISGALELGHLVELANRALARNRGLDIRSAGVVDSDDLTAIIQVGTSAGGARAKAVIGWNEQTGEVRSGQTSLPEGFVHWLLKFDGVAANSDKELADPLGCGRIEHAYAEMAKATGISMAPTRLLTEGGRAHFMTRRFDRPDGKKLHLQSLTAIAHFDFNQAGAHSYEQALQVTRRLGLHQNDRTDLYRRAVFNVVARNQDDHTKNIAFLMDQSGTWSLAPAYDITYSFNPSGEWTSTHKMSINGKRTRFTRSDFVALAAHANLSDRDGLGILDNTIEVVSGWARFGADAGVDADRIQEIAANLMLTSLR
ncbi:MAG: type II toxin-antitoxin system HipA family toxin [Actinobacteria bacterium]|nr:type II toxin-antitoxin system HipA family toxin [Actinomycetota bacterium]